MSWYKVRHPFSCCEGIVRKPFAGTLWMNQATCSCPKQKDYENPTQDSYIKIIKMERQLTSGLSESLVATNDISFTPSINSWHFLQPRPPFRRCTTGVYPNFPSPLGGAMRRASSTYRGSKKFNGNSGSSWEAPWYHESSTACMHCAVERFWTVEKWLLLWLHSKIPWKCSTPRWLLSTSFLSQETTHPAVRRVSEVAEGLLQTEKRQIFDPQTSTRQARHGMQEGPGVNRGKAMGWPQCWSELVSSWDVLQPSVLHSPMSTAHFHSSCCFWSLPCFHLKAVLKWITLKVANCHAATDSYWAEQFPEFSEPGNVFHSFCIHSISFSVLFFSWIFQHPPVKRLSWAKSSISHNIALQQKVDLWLTSPASMRQNSRNI